MDIFEAIAKRHSYRGAYSDETISRNDLTKIVQAGLQAPSGKNAQTTTFVIIDDSKIIDRIRLMHSSNKAVQTANAYIVCIVDQQPKATYEGFSFQIEDCAAAVENMLLAITGLGYASVWVDGWLRINNNAQQIRELINLPADKKIQILLPVGKPIEEYRQPAKKPFSERVWFNSYDIKNTSIVSKN